MWINIRVHIPRKVSSSMWIGVWIEQMNVCMGMDVDYVARVN